MKKVITTIVLLITVMMAPVNCYAQGAAIAKASRSMAKSLSKTTKTMPKNNQATRKYFQDLEKANKGTGSSVVQRQGSTSKTSGINYPLVVGKGAEAVNKNVKRNMKKCVDCNGRGSFMMGRNSYTCKTCSGRGYVYQWK